MINKTLFLKELNRCMTNAGRIESVWMAEEHMRSTPAEIVDLIE